MKKVLIIEAQMKQYRAAFYAGLYERLRRAGARLTVAYSDAPPSEAHKRDTCELPVDYGVKVKGYWLWPEKLIYQPLLHSAMGSDLVIVDQGNRLLLNHLLLPLSRLGLKRVAFWGHGENRAQAVNRFSEWYRRKTLNSVSWWFAYTKGTARYLEAQGVPPWKITAVQNAIDTREIQETVEGLSVQERAAQRLAMDIPESAKVGIFCGMLDKVKGLPFLIESSRIIKAKIPAFHLIVVGGGSEQNVLQKLVEGLDWIHALGPRFGMEKAGLLAISDVFLLPGKVGLAILDAFAAGLPMLTTRFRFHAPEIEYLEEGVNGLASDEDPLAYADAVSFLIDRNDYLAQLKAGARRSAKKYSMEAMVENFSEGILRCFEQPKWKWAASQWREEKQPSPSSPIASIEMDFRTTPESPNGNGAHPAFADANRTCSNGEPDRRCFLTTSWDDGHPLDFRIAELLTKYGLPGTFYIPRSSQLPVMNVEQIRELSRTFEIGAHTLDHVAIHCFSDTEASSQLSGSRQWIEEVTGKKCDLFCFPGGKYKPGQLRLVREAGFQAARTVELLCTAEPRHATGLQIIPTTIQAFPHRRYAYLKNAAKRFAFGRIVPLSAAMCAGDWVVLAKQLLLHTVEHGGVFHLWGHSWEIEEQNQWQDLEELLKTISTWRQSFKGVTNSELCQHAA